MSQTKKTLSLEEAVTALKAMANPVELEKQSRFGIRGENRLGVTLPQMQAISKGVCDHALALQLWQTGIHEARIMAGMVDDPALVTREQMETWAKDFDSWDVTDLVCGGLLDASPYAFECALEWPHRPEEFIRRAGFVLMCGMAVHNKAMHDTDFEPFFPLMIQYATDDRNFVKKAVNWALRQVGKRNRALCLRAIAVAEEIRSLNTPTARWIASDAIRELTGKLEKPPRSWAKG
ncbi:MAG TPA: DNA alkylation repair protein [Longilinea sp.]|nr:DNA alkylation repair protein [Longilinea sp.]